MSPQTLFSQLALEPLTELPDDLCIPLEVPEDEKQLRVDCVNVLEGRVDISTFEPERQEKIKNYYRFYGTQFSSEIGVNARKTRHTLDIV